MGLTLEPIDEALLAGAHGPAAARAMAMLVRYGQALGAERFIPIVSAHIDGCLFHGQASLDFARRFVELQGRVRVPTTLNAAAIDVTHPGWSQGDPDLLDCQAELTELHERLGCLPTLTCAPYQRIFRPRAGEHIAWAESNAIVFANSVLGARTDRYGDFTDLCAALTGRVPELGLHLAANRRAALRLDAPDVAQTGLVRDIYFACLGYVSGAVADGRVPAITGLPADTSEDELKALGASAASSGALAMFHAVGLTLEAQTLEAAAGGEAHGLARIAIGAGDLHEALARLCPLAPGEPISAVCLGTPHFSLAEFRRLAGLLQGRRRAEGVELYVSTSREIAAEVDQDPALAAVAAFGTRVVVDTCTYLSPVVRTGQAAIVTNSGKWAHYGPGNLKRRVGLMSLERCIRSAELGRVAP
jgi:predicted aconitase